MKRLTFLSAVLFCLAVFFCSPSKMRQPNIVLIVIDALRADFLGCYGADPSPSPFIDSLAEKGLRFEWAYSQAPRTFESSVALFTGLYPHQVAPPTSGYYQLPDNIPTFIKSLREQGYYCEAFNTNPNLKFGVLRDFDKVHDLVSTDRKNGRLIINFASAHEILTRPEKLPQPFFKYVHLMEVHGPWYIEGEQFDQSDAPRHPEKYLSLYINSISYIDKEIQRFVQNLEKDTILVITADHGQEILEYGPWCDHGNSLYPENVHVPLIISGPGIKAGTEQRTYETNRLSNFFLTGELTPSPALTEIATKVTQGWAIYDRDLGYAEYTLYRGDPTPFELGNQALRHLMEERISQPSDSAIISDTDQE
ncbi:MAG: sulfatase, partial [Candidatus Abyssubacteria bacterium]|nr:sulfatase [Candidatus Abyssubacteria bacterium]